MLLHKLTRMIDFRKELEEVLRMKHEGGFHYVYQAEQLAEKAREARKLKNLLRTPVTRWKRVLKDTRFVLEQLKAEEI